MQIDITGHHLKVTTALRNYVEKKFKRLTKHFDNVINIHVVLTVEKLTHKAEASLHVRGNRIFANSNNEGMYAAVDSLVDKLDRQIVKHKEKLKDHHQDEVRHHTTH
ncbi:MAG: ribosome-associated translation inhibitor RaiA [Gammaproteobacteria bacterium]|nr:ribosome-associated translation inhibitor RaiA [Gammaproteobacteria bacterium]